MHKKRTNPTDSFGAANKAITKTGGYLRRSHDTPSGHQLIWQVYSKFQIMCQGFALRGVYHNLCQFMVKGRATI
jgi:hypothetical protein